jgi:molybdopterin synthase catalytic subunit
MGTEVKPPVGPDWVALSTEALPLDLAGAWVVQPGCGALVVFAGTVRDHAEGRPGVVTLEYEAYEEQVEPRLAQLAADMRQRWPALGRIVLWHRCGPLAVTDVSVVVGLSAPHRPEAFDAARYGIDTLKATVPIWKRETWEGGSAWGLDSHPVVAGPGGEVGS